MSDIAIQVDKLSKRYRIGKSAKNAGGKRSILKTIAQPFDYLISSLREPSPDEIIWALRDVSFSVKQAETIGIIGRNGAGKSTLLKILSRITEPTSGRILLNGRVGSLLEVGTGFHPELTGRENVYLSGAILGMKRAEIDRKFDEIVAFSEIDKFIDTPVKRYSSGMYVRLAFGVAAHLEPEILLVDEVLAVGDAAFQKKCLGKMGDVAKEGRTVLFVSHNMVAVQSLCSRSVWINGGQVMEEGPTGQIISSYLSTSYTALTERVWDAVSAAPGNDKVRLHRVSVHPKDASASDTISMQSPLDIEVEFWNLRPEARLHVTMHLFTEQQIVAFSTSNTQADISWRNHAYETGLYRTVCHIPGNFLNSGIYQVTLLIVENSDTVVYEHEDLVSFEVNDLDRRLGHWYGREPGVIQPWLQWSTEYIGEGEGK
jgi:lipopolysaccharide transport system ATP-binding protein